MDFGAVSYLSLLLPSRGTAVEGISSWQLKLLSLFPFVWVISILPPSFLSQLNLSLHASNLSEELSSAAPHLHATVGRRGLKKRLG